MLRPHGSIQTSHATRKSAYSTYSTKHTSICTLRPTVCAHRLLNITSKSPSKVNHLKVFQYATQTHQEASWAHHVANNTTGTVVLNGTTYVTGDLINPIKEVRPRQGSTNRS